MADQPLPLLPPPKGDSGTLAGVGSPRPTPPSPRRAASGGVIFTASLSQRRPYKSPAARHEAALREASAPLPLSPQSAAAGGSNHNNHSLVTTTAGLASTARSDTGTVSSDLTLSGGGDRERFAGTFPSLRRPAGADPFSTVGVHGSLTRWPSPRYEGGQTAADFTSKQQGNTVINSSSHAVGPLPDAGAPELARRLADVVRTHEALLAAVVAEKREKEKPKGAAANGNTTPSATIGDTPSTALVLLSSSPPSSPSSPQPQPSSLPHSPTDALLFERHEGLCRAVCGIMGAHFRPYASVMAAVARSAGAMGTIYASLQDAMALVEANGAAIDGEHRATVAALEGTIAALQTEVARLADTERALGTIAALEEDKAALSIRYEEAEKRCRKLKAALSELHDKHSLLQHRHTIAAGGEERAKGLVSRHEAALEDLATQVRLLTVDKESLQKAVERLEGDAAEERRRTERISQQLASYEERCAKMSEENNLLRYERSKLQRGGGALSGGSYAPTHHSSIAVASGGSIAAVMGIGGGGGSIGGASISPGVSYAGPSPNFVFGAEPSINGGGSSSPANASEGGGSGGGGLADTLYGAASSVRVGGGINAVFMGGGGAFGGGGGGASIANSYQQQQQSYAAAGRYLRAPTPRPEWASFGAVVAEGRRLVADRRYTNASALLNGGSGPAAEQTLRALTADAAEAEQSLTAASTAANGSNGPPSVPIPPTSAEKAAVVLEQAAEANRHMKALRGTVRALIARVADLERFHTVISTAAAPPNDTTVASSEVAGAIGSSSPPPLTLLGAMAAKGSLSAAPPSADDGCAAEADSVAGAAIGSHALAEGRAAAEAQLKVLSAELEAAVAHNRSLTLSAAVAAASPSPSFFSPSSAGGGSDPNSTASPSPSASPTGGGRGGLLMRKSTTIPNTMGTVSSNANTAANNNLGSSGRRSVRRKSLSSSTAIGPILLTAADGPPTPIITNSNANANIGGTANSIKDDGGKMMASGLSFDAFSAIGGEAVVSRANSVTDSSPNAPSQSQPQSQTAAAATAMLSASTTQRNPSASLGSGRPLRGGAEVTIIGEIPHAHVPSPPTNAASSSPSSSSRRRASSVPSAQQQSHSSPHATPSSGKGAAHNDAATVAALIAPPTAGLVSHMFWSPNASAAASLTAVSLSAHHPPAPASMAIAGGAAALLGGHFASAGGGGGVSPLSALAAVSSVEAAPAVLLVANRIAPLIAKTVFRLALAPAAVAAAGHISPAAEGAAKDVSTGGSSSLAATVVAAPGGTADETDESPQCSSEASLSKALTKALFEQWKAQRRLLAPAGGKEAGRRGRGGGAAAAVFSSPSSSKGHSNALGAASNPFTCPLAMLPHASAAPLCLGDEALTSLWGVLARRGAHCAGLGPQQQQQQPSAATITAAESCAEDSVIVSLQKAVFRHRLSAVLAASASAATSVSSPAAPSPARVSGAVSGSAAPIRLMGAAGLAKGVAAAATSSEPKQQSAAATSDTIAESGAFDTKGDFSFAANALATAAAEVAKGLPEVPNAGAGKKGAGAVPLPPSASATPNNSNKRRDASPAVVAPSSPSPAAEGAPRPVTPSTEAKEKGAAAAAAAAADAQSFAVFAATAHLRASSLAALASAPVLEHTALHLPLHVLLEAYEAVYDYITMTAAYCTNAKGAVCHFGGAPPAEPSSVTSTSAPPHLVSPHSLSLAAALGGGAKSLVAPASASSSSSAPSPSPSNGSAAAAAPPYWEAEAFAKSSAAIAAAAGDASLRPRRAVYDTLFVDDFVACAEAALLPKMRAVAAIGRAHDGLCGTLKRRMAAGAAAEAADGLGAASGGGSGRGGRSSDRSRGGGGGSGGSSLVRQKSVVAGNNIPSTVGGAVAASSNVATNGSTAAAAASPFMAPLLGSVGGPQQQQRGAAASAHPEPSAPAAAPLVFAAGDGSGLDADPSSSITLESVLYSILFHTLRLQRTVPAARLFLAHLGGAVPKLLFLTVRRQMRAAMGRAAEKTGGLMAVRATLPLSVSSAAAGSRQSSSQQPATAAAANGAASLYRGHYAALQASRHQQQQHQRLLAGGGGGGGTSISMGASVSTPNALFLLGGAGGGASVLPHFGANPSATATPSSAALQTSLLIPPPPSATPSLTDFIASLAEDLPMYGDAQLAALHEALLADPALGALALEGAGTGGPLHYMQIGGGGGGGGGGSSGFALSAALADTLVPKAPSFTPSRGLLIPDRGNSHYQKEPLSPGGITSPYLLDPHYQAINALYRRAHSQQFGLMAAAASGGGLRVPEAHFVGPSTNASGGFASFDGGQSGNSAAATTPSLISLRHSLSSPMSIFAQALASLALHHHIASVGSFQAALRDVVTMTGGGGGGSNAAATRGGYSQPSAGGMFAVKTSTGTGPTPPPQPQPLPAGAPFLLRPLGLYPNNETVSVLNVHQALEKADPMGAAAGVGGGGAGGGGGGRGPAAASEAMRRLVAEVCCGDPNAELHPRQRVYARDVALRLPLVSYLRLTPVLATHSVAAAAAAGVGGSAPPPTGASSLLDQTPPSTVSGSPSAAVANRSSAAAVASSSNAFAVGRFATHTGALRHFASNSAAAFADAMGAVGGVGGGQSGALHLHATSAPFAADDSLQLRFLGSRVGLVGAAAAALYNSAAAE